MKLKFLKNLPRISILLSAIFLLSTIFFSYNKASGYLLALSSGVINEPQNWYRFLSYPIVNFEFKIWLLNSIGFILMGWVIEQRVSVKLLVILITISIVSSGLFYAIINEQDNEYIFSFGIIGWSYMGILIVIGCFYWSTYHWLEKVVTIFYLIFSVISYITLPKSGSNYLFYTFLFATIFPSIILYFKLTRSKKT